MSEWEEKDDGGRINPKIDLERRRGDYRIVELAGFTGFVLWPGPRFGGITGFLFPGPASQAFDRLRGMAQFFPDNGL